MEQPKREMRLTAEEQRLKERLMRKKSASDEIRYGAGRVPDDLWNMPRPKITDGSLLEALLRDREGADSGP
jgi:hypothetical protein